jgi:hypothetical protein
MKDILSRLADSPLSPTMTVVVGIVLLVVVWRMVKGMAKTVIMLGIIAAVIAVLVWMGLMDRPELPGR